MRAARQARTQTAKQTGIDLRQIAKEKVTLARTTRCDCDVSAHRHPSGRCSATISFKKASALHQSPQHFCKDCLPDWRRRFIRQIARKNKQLRGDCGHLVSASGVRQCSSCYDRHAPRGSYKDTAISLQAAAERLGRDVSVNQLAREAAVSWSTAKRFLADPGQFDARPATVPDHPDRGTTAGFQRHLREGETPCKPCRDALNRDNRRRYRERKEGKTRELKPCGTVAALSRHKRRGEPPCEECAQEYRVYQEQRRRTKGTAARMLPSHGTPGGYERHRKAGESPCEACLAAFRYYNRTRTAERRRRKGTVAAPVQGCGTNAGYARHRHKGEAPCEACRAAHNEDARRRRQARKG